MISHLRHSAVLPALFLSLVFAGCSPKSGIIQQSQSSGAVRTADPSVESKASERVIGKPAATRVEAGQRVFPTRGGRQQRQDGTDLETAPALLSDALSPRSLELSARSSSMGPLLLSKALENVRDGNVALSPVSLEMVLGMVLRGTDDDGKAEILHSLNLDGVSLEEVSTYHHEVLGALNALSASSLKVRLANALWAQTGFPINQEYVQGARKYYEAKVENLDFAGDASGAVRRINAWGSESTDGLIPSVLSSIPSSTRLILANATYMKADWAHPFDEGNTRKDVFHMADGSQVQADFMVQTLRTGYCIGEGYTAVRLPYVGEDLVMTLVLPDQGRDMNALIPLLSPSGIPFQSGRVALRMPKFTFSFSRNLTGELRQMGVNRVFTDNSLPLIAPSLAVSQMLQSDFIQVDETGTKAAAITIGMISTTSVGTQPVSITLDRPFLFCISSLKTGCVLMLGRVSDPR